MQRGDPEHVARSKRAEQQIVALGLLVAVACGGRQTPAQAPRRAVEHVILVTVDGMVPATYREPDAHGLKVPTLRAFADGGLSVDGAISVVPTVTYPAHASIATGALPGKHGIVTNHAFDPLLRNLEGWRWYAEDLKVPAIWDAARDAGLTTALINWPVTVGAKATVNVPEYWRSGQPDDQKLTRAFSTPGVLDEVARKHPDLWQRFTPPSVKDSVSFDIAVHLLETRPPNLMLIHVWNVDDAQHGFGLWSDEARTSLEEVDRQLARLVDAAKKAGIWQRTVIVVASDHGFAPVSRSIRPGVLLARAGLVTLDANGLATGWRASVLTSGGQAYVYVKDPADAEAAKEALAHEAIVRIRDRAEIAESGGDPTATFSLDSAPGWQFAHGYTGDPVGGTGKTAATHGWDPEDPAMHASLLVYGPPVAAGRLERARLVDIAPTIATWLDLALPDADGRSLLGSTGAAAAPPRAGDGVR